MKIVKKSILIIGPKPPPYHGVSVAIEKLLQSDLKNNFNVVHIDLSDRRGIEYVGKPDIIDIMIFINQFLRTIKAIACMRPLIAYVPISQTNIGFLRDSFFIILCYIAKCRILLHLHGGNFKYWYVKKNRIFACFINIVLNKIAGVIVLNEKFKNIFYDFMNEDKIFVVSNGVEQEYFDNKKYPVNKSGKSMRILYLGNLNRRKGVNTLIESMAYVTKVNPNIKCNIAGAWSDARDKSEAEEFIKINNLGKYINFLGPVSGRNKWKTYYENDIFVFPGIQQEGQPLVVLEAMAAKLPILYTDRGCLKNILNEKVNGIQIRIGDAKDIAEKILFLYNNINLLEKMGKNNLEKYRKCFTAKQYQLNMLKVFNKIFKCCTQ